MTWQDSLGELVIERAATGAVQQHSTGPQRPDGFTALTTIEPSRRLVVDGSVNPSRSGKVGPGQTWEVTHDAQDTRFRPRTGARRPGDRLAAGARNSVVASGGISAGYRHGFGVAAVIAAALALLAAVTVPVVRPAAGARVAVQ